MPIALSGHSMVTLGFGIAIFGGRDANENFRKEIYHFACYKRICKMTTLNQELSTPRGYFVAIPIPDSMSGCISDSKSGCYCLIIPHTLPNCSQKSS